MSKLNFYIFRQVFVASFLIAATLACVVLLVQSMRLIELIINRGLSATNFFYLSSLLMPNLLQHFLAMGLFLGLIMVYRRLIIEGELVVMKAAGISNLRLMTPAILAGLTISLIVAALSFYLVPESSRAMRAQMTKNQTQFGSALLQEGRFNTIGSDITLFAGQREGEVLRQLIYDNRQDPNDHFTIFAEEGQLIAEGGRTKLAIRNGFRQSVQDGQLRYVRFDRSLFDLTPEARQLTRQIVPADQRLLPDLLFPEDEITQPHILKELHLTAIRMMVVPLFPLALAGIAVAILLRATYSRHGMLGPFIQLAFVGTGAIVVWQALFIGIEKLPNLVPVLFAYPLILAIGGFVMAAQLAGVTGRPQISLKKQAKATAKMIPIGK